MLDQIKSIYSKFPYPFKIIGASLWGFYLKWLRYGLETEQLIDEAYERESWEKDRWISWYERRIAFILNQAVHHVPYYQKYWQGKKQSWELLENWPILKKQKIRENPSQFLIKGIKPRRLYKVHTSGSTGTPLTLYWSRKICQQWYALYEARIRQWYGVSRFDRWGILGGQLVTDIRRKSPPFWVWNQGLNQLYMSVYHIRHDNVRHYLNAMKKHRIVFLLGYPSALDAIARYGLEMNVSPPELKVIITNAEPLFDHQRKRIEMFFQCPVRNTYGMAEIVAAGSECEYGIMHAWPEVGIIEVFDEMIDQSIECNHPGRLICTGLINDVMPLIRYEVGDRGHGIDWYYSCKCGRRLPKLKEVVGRLDDIIQTPDGRIIGRLDPVFKTDFPIQEAQIIQEELNFIRMKVVPSLNYNKNTEYLLIKRLRERLGDEIRIEIEIVESIPRTDRGKFRAVISKLKGQYHGVETTGVE